MEIHQDSDIFRRIPQQNPHIPQKLYPKISVTEVRQNSPELAGGQVIFAGLLRHNLPESPISRSNLPESKKDKSSHKGGTFFSLFPRISFLPSTPYTIYPLPSAVPLFCTHLPSTAFHFLQICHLPPIQYTLRRATFCTHYPSPNESGTQDTHLSVGLITRTHRTVPPVPHTDLCKYA